MPLHVQKFKEDNPEGYSAAEVPSNGKNPHKFHEVMGMFLWKEEHHFLKELREGDLEAMVSPILCVAALCTVVTQAVITSFCVQEREEIQRALGLLPGVLVASISC